MYKAGKWYKTIDCTLHVYIDEDCMFTTYCGEVISGNEPFLILEIKSTYEMVSNGFATVAKVLYFGKIGYVVLVNGQFNFDIVEHDA